MFREIILPIFRSTRLCVTVCGIMHPRCCRPVKKIPDNEIYLLIKYIKSVLWRVAKRVSYIEEARCLKVKSLRKIIPEIESWFVGRVSHSLVSMPNILSYYPTRREGKLMANWDRTSRIVCTSNSQDRPCTYNVTLRRVRAAVLAVEKQWLLRNVSVCVFFGLRYPACNAHASYCHLWLAPLYIILHYFSTLSLKGIIFFKKKRVTEHKMCFDFLYNFFFWNISHSNKNRARYKNSAGLHVKYPVCLSDCN